MIELVCVRSGNEPTAARARRDRSSDPQRRSALASGGRAGGWVCGRERRAGGHEEADWRTRWEADGRLARRRAECGRSGVPAGWRAGGWNGRRVICRSRPARPRVVHHSGVPSVRCTAPAGPAGVRPAGQRTVQTTGKSAYDATAILLSARSPAPVRPTSPPHLPARWPAWCGNG